MASQINAIGSHLLDEAQIRVHNAGRCPNDPQETREEIEFRDELTITTSTSELCELLSFAETDDNGRMVIVLTGFSDRLELLGSHQADALTMTAELLACGINGSHAVSKWYLSTR